MMNAQTTQIITITDAQKANLDIADILSGKQDDLDSTFELVKDSLEMSQDEKPQSIQNLKEYSGDTIDSQSHNLDKLAYTDNYRSA